MIFFKEQIKYHCSYVLICYLARIANSANYHVQQLGIRCNFFHSKIRYPLNDVLSFRWSGLEINFDKNYQLSANKTSITWFRCREITNINGYPLIDVHQNALYLPHGLGFLGSDRGSNLILHAH